MLHILWEGGFIDQSLVKNPRKMRYSKQGKKQDFEEISGYLKEESGKYNMTDLISQCSDFKNEKSDIECLCCELSINLHSKFDILFSPKYHCELAGEGVEYSWGAAKRLYRRLPIKLKRSVAGFQDMVRVCISKVTIAMCRKFSAKARGYMLAYSHKKLSVDDTLWSYEYTEKIHKIYRSHRDVNCIDGAYIEKVLRESVGLTP